eukprot:1184229-Prorocentrum_minimum.AAC.3
MGQNDNFGNIWSTTSGPLLVVVTRARTSSSAERRAFPSSSSPCPPPPLWGWLGCWLSHSLRASSEVAHAATCLPAAVLAYGTKSPLSAATRACLCLRRARTAAAPAHMAAMAA